VLFAVAFDPDRRKVTGGAVPLIEGVEQPVGVRAAGANYAVSQQGTLVYVAASAGLRSLVWVDRRGAPTPITAIPPGAYDSPRLSPDGGRVLLTRATSEGGTNVGDIWVYDVASGRSSRISKDGSSLMGVWDPKGSQVAY